MDEMMKPQFTTILVTEANIRRRLVAAHDLNLRYASIAELCLFHGGVREANIMDTPLERMRQGNCFGNAFKLMLDNPNFTYVEGMATMRCAGIWVPTAHAWVVDEMGMIHDPTWKDCVLQQTPEHLQTPENLRYIGQAVYCGLRVPRRGAMLSTLLHDTVNMLVFDDTLQNPFLLAHGLEHFEHLSVGHVGPLDWCDGNPGPLMRHAKMDRLKHLAAMPDDELTWLCKEFLASQPMWVREGNGYRLEGTEKTWVA